MNNLNPTFTKSITLNYQFERIQEMKFEVVDVDTGSNFDLIGEIETSIGNIMGSSGQTLQKELLNPKRKKNGTIIVRAESLQKSNDMLMFRIKGDNLMNIGGGCMGMCEETMPCAFQIHRASTADHSKFNCVFTSK